jgi:hypothetical protein
MQGLLRKGGSDGFVSLWLQIPNVTLVIGNAVFEAYCEFVYRDTAYNLWFLPVTPYGCRTMHTPFPNHIGSLVRIAPI